jgi:hypothetical protein
MGAVAGPTDLTSMPSIPQQMPAQRDPQPQPLPPRVRLEEMLGRDFTDFLLDALTDAPSHHGRRGLSSP